MLMDRAEVCNQDNEKIEWYRIVVQLIEYSVHDMTFCKRCMQDMGLDQQDSLSTQSIDHLSW